MRRFWLWGGLAVLGVLLFAKRAGDETPFDANFLLASRRFALPPNLLKEVARQESGFDPSAYNAASSASGLMQFTPATASDYGLDVWDPVASINAAALYLSRLYSRFGSWPKALAAYNWGPENVARKGLAAAPAETRAYVSNITSRAGMPFSPPWG